jgi:hypothetical protein
MSRRKLVRRALVLLVVMAAAAAAAAVANSAFFRTTASSGNSLVAAPDWKPPTSSAQTAIRVGACAPTAGRIKQGSAYYVYANVADDPSSNPPSGTSTVTANLNSITTGATASSLASGSYTVGATSYNYRTASVTANNPLAEGAPTYSLTSTDVAANAGTQSGFAVTVDNTAPTGSDVQTANHGATVGKPETTDTITYTYSEAIDACSILAGWTGSSTSVVVRLVDGGPKDDLAQVWNAANTAQLPLGSLDLGPSKGDYTSGAGAVFGSTGTPCTMVMSGNTITVTLGTLSTGTVKTNNKADNMVWTPSATATDLAGNGASTATVTETGASDEEF